LSAGYKNRTIEDELVIDSDGVVAELSFDHLNLCLSNCRLEEVIERNNQEIERRMTHLENKLIKVSKELELRDLIFHEKLNDGVFGAVLRVSSTALMTNYVLKVYSKKRVAEEDIIKLIASQKKILERIGNPFIVSLAKTFVNADNYYFLMEYVRGADLLDVMKEIGLLSSNDSKFLVATMIYILQYLHYHGIIHRDFKPENFMITEHGYLKLIEMLTAKALKNKAGRTFTILGTPHYMAPEIMVNKGYSTYVDLWSVGVMLYEMLCGVMPFGEDTSTPNDIYEDILKDNLRFPTTLKDKKARKLIEQLLSRNPESRLGGSYASLMSHPWL
jgi:cGMP-dependent protein kinase 1